MIFLETSLSFKWIVIKKALVTGITGQDGAYLAEFLIQKGYEVHGLKRRTSLFNTRELIIYIKIIENDLNFILHHGDMTDSTNIIRLIKEIEPDEIYNLVDKVMLQLALKYLSIQLTQML